MKGDHLGELEELVLLAVYGLAENAYGGAVVERLEATAGRKASLGAIYSALDRLERKACLTSRVGGATPERGGRRKRLFTITPTGEETLARLRESRRAMWKLVSSSHA